MGDGLVITVAALGWESATEPLSPAGDRDLTRDFRLRPAQVALEGIVAVGFGTNNRAPWDAEINEKVAAAGWAPAEREEISRLLGRGALRIAGMQALETRSVGWMGSPPCASGRSSPVERSPCFCNGLNPAVARLLERLQ